MIREHRKHFIEGMRFPLALDAVETPPAPCEFRVGDVVTFTNDNGVVFPDMVVTGFSPTVEHGRFVYFDKDAWWFPVRPANLTKQATLEKAQDASHADRSELPQERAAPALIWWNVTMAWGEDDEGTYSASFLATDGDAAALMCATEMAESGEVEFENEAHRDGFIVARLAGYSDVYRTDAQFRGDFERLFGEALFGDGPRCAIDLERLREVLVANRDAILDRPAVVERPRGG